MKKIYIGLAVSAVIVLSLGLVGFSYARNFRSSLFDRPYGHMFQQKGGYRHGPGMMGWDQDFGTSMMAWDDDFGPMHDSMVAALAQALDLSIDEIETRIEAGESMWQISVSSGLTEDDVYDLMQSIHQEHMDIAVESGWMTQDQVDWMDDHMEQMWDGTWSGSFGNHCGEWGR